MTYPGRRAPTGEPDWLTLGQAAKFLGVAQSTIRKWSDQGRVPAFYTPGGHRRYRRRDLEALLDRPGPGSKAGRPPRPPGAAFPPRARPRRARRRDLEAFLDRSGPGSKAGGPLVLVVDDDPRL